MSITCAAETLLQTCTPIFRSAVVTLYLVYFNSATIRNYNCNYNYNYATSRLCHACIPM